MEVCDLCGGRTEWTLFAGERYVRCVAECDQLTLDGFELLPSDSEDAGHAWSREVMGTSGGKEGVPLGGHAAETSRIERPDSLPDVPEGFLEALWEGNDYGTR